MTAKVINGKEIANNIRLELEKKIKESKCAPRLAVIWIGDNASSAIYVKNKQKVAREIGMECDVHHFPENVAEIDVINLIDSLNQNVDVNGIIVQLPIPKHLNQNKILELISTDKDVDAFKQEMVGSLWLGKSDWASATPEGVLYLLRSELSDLTGMHAVIVGRSNIVGKPLAALLLQNNCTVTIAHSKTKNLSDIVKNADIVVAACGCPKLIKKSWVKSGALVIDVGINYIDGKICGDVDFNEVKEVAKAITPVPGGVGPMTIAMLLENTYKAYLKQKDSL